MMARRRFGQSDIEITPIGLGCQQLAETGLVGRAWDTPDEGATQAMVKAALAGGVNWFDTAEMYGYGQSERALTSALHGARVEPGQVVVATKWYPQGRRASNIARTIDDRISALQGYPIDLYQIHAPTSFSTATIEMREMAKLVRAQKIRAIGVSNFSVRGMTRASAALQAQGLALASNQVQISLLHRNIERNGMLNAARRLGVTLIGYSPLAGGVLTGRFHDHPELVSGLSRARRLQHRSRFRTLAQTQPLIDELGKVAEAYGVSRAQVALNWVAHFYGDTVVAIPGASKPRQAQESAEALGFRLTTKELTRLDELSRPSASG
jgi:aryl-alcohol dehydrogenase-like predicted oxidoreductase